jgi:hypothetical protein
MVSSMMDVFLWLSLLIGLPGGYGFYYCLGQQNFSEAQRRTTARFGIFMLVFSLIALLILCSVAFIFTRNLKVIVELIVLSIIEALLIFGLNILLEKMKIKDKN